MNFYYTIITKKRHSIECAVSSGVKVNMTPKTIKSLISTISKSLDYKEGSCYNRTTVELKKV